MKTTNLKKTISAMTFAVAAAGFSLVAQADNVLGGETLTRFGAEKAGNADGSIPPYTGGLDLNNIPASFVPGSGQYPNPFADEKPLLKINAANMHEHEQFLTPTVKHFMENNPDYFINVYPTHRTMKYPEWVLENTEKNQKTAKLIGDKYGDGVEGAYGGIPFPVPTDGHQVMWNFMLHYRPVWTKHLGTCQGVRESGAITLLSVFDMNVRNDYYDRSKTSVEDPYFWKYLSNNIEPPAQNGYNLLMTSSINYTDASALAWVYTPGQRRVRTAPEFSYDTPAANYSGMVLYDEINMFAGRQDRFDFKIIGKEEKYVPYNEYRTAPSEFVSEQEFLTPVYSNPEHHRFEKHRVWVVEGTLRDGARHITPRIRMYIDEDSWIILERAGYDAAGNLYRGALNFPFLTYDAELPVMSYLSYDVYDLNKNVYMSCSNTAASSDKLRFEYFDRILDQAGHTPDRLSARGVR